MVLAHQQITNEFDKLKQDEAEKSSRLQELMLVSKKRSSTNRTCSTNPSPTESIKSNQSCYEDNLLIENICGYYDELQDNKFQKINRMKENPLTSKFRKNLANRQMMVDRRAKYCKESNCNLDLKLRKSTDLKESLSGKLSSILSTLEPLALPTLQFHLILSLTMVLLTHQCPSYIYVL